MLKSVKGPKHDLGADRGPAVRSEYKEIESAIR